MADVTLKIRIPQRLAESLEEVLLSRGATLDDFFRMAARSYTRMPEQFGLRDTLTVGKYSGELVEDVMRTHPDYIGWCVSNMAGFRLDQAASELLNHLHKPIKKSKPTLKAAA